MVHIKRVELTNFKSFGGTTPIPLLPGFTVVSGPNGSGKSNILDALLFCLGLASSKGMRAERLPDLVNHNKERRGTVEASVTVTFDLLDIKSQVSGVGGEGEEENLFTTEEWSVTRRLRVTKQDTYTSNYYINGEACTLTELHEQLNRLRIYPEGYNVVLQGDVTRIISMNSRERREIIDELAGVAAFDRKISQTRETLDEVKEREERCRIIEKELITQCDRLAADRIKAEKYQKLRGEVQIKQEWEAVLKWRLLQEQVAALNDQISIGDREQAHLTCQLAALNAQINETTTALDSLNARVKELGEAEQVAVASTLATQEAERRELQTRQQELTHRLAEINHQLQTTEEEIEQYQQTLEQIIQQRQTLETEIIARCRQQRDTAQSALNHSREQASAIANASEVWVQQQTTLTRQIETLLQSLNPKRTEQAQLQERYHQLSRQIEEQTQLLHNLAPEIADKQAQARDLTAQLATSAQHIPALTQSLAAIEQELQTQQQTQTRLLSEQREKQRQLDKLEAQTQAQLEAQGTYATKVILQANIPGVCGLVAQLGYVAPRYQLALETAAGGRLGNLVVEDDGIAADLIELLKQKRAGRATFLPLNKIQPPRFSENLGWRSVSGFVDYAVNLIECDLRYRIIFAYVLGNTLVFATLDQARPYIGQCRMVTLAGEILESSGAMTGGSVSPNTGLHFGRSDAGESAEMIGLRQRLQVLEQILERCQESITENGAAAKHLGETLAQARAKHGEIGLRLEQLDREMGSLRSQEEQLRSLLAKNTPELNTASDRLQVLNHELPAQETQLQDLRQQLAQLEQSQTPSEWQEMQRVIKVREAELSESEQALRAAEKELQDLDNQQHRLAEKSTEAWQRIAQYQTEQNSLSERISRNETQLGIVNKQITQTRAKLAELEQKLGEVKQERDRIEAELRHQHLQQQQLSWELEKLQETQLTRREELTNLQTQLELQQTELPDPIPDVPVLVQPTTSDESAGKLIAFDSITEQLAQLQKEIRNGQKRLQAMEPVNMLALEEYDRTQTRLQELSEKLTTLEAERTELLLRIENFTTLRFRSFKEAFDAINENFQTIFAELSDGDGYLQLDDPNDPFNGGLNLVAHPKGKPVQRLASMSGGEKSLTALSFIFALQRYRPSPFYAFDEVDMFLDGSNVERLAKMIKQQAKLAQFIVVSLRRPMIESSDRAIGVTQARGAYTQVLGLKL